MCLWLLCVMVSSYYVVNMSPCVFLTVMCHGLILQCCKHETMWDVDGLILQCCKHETMCVCDCYVSMVWSYRDVNTRPRVFMTLWVNRLNFNFVIMRQCVYDSIMTWADVSIILQCCKHDMIHVCLWLCVCYSVNFLV